MLDTFLNFTLNTHEKIIISSSNNQEKCCRRATIYFESNDSKIMLFNDSLVEAVQAFLHVLQDALSAKKFLHPSITQDIGLMWNKELHEESGLEYEDNDDQKFWVGQKHLIWSTPGDSHPCLDTWLYSTADGAIVFQITPTYPWHNTDPNPGEPFISYKEFMANYKPIFKKNIPQSIAKKWTDQVLLAIKQKYPWLLEKTQK